MAPKLSVVVPFYGVEDYIDDCLATIAAQTYADFECILIDDGSRDGSRAIADRWAVSDPRFRVIEQPNAGLGAARNTGTRHALGEYLMFVDSDDLLAPRAFEQLVTSLDATGSDFAAGNVWRQSLQWGLVVSSAHAEQFAERRERVTITDVPLLIRDRMIWNKVFRRSFWDGFGYAFPEIRFEDYPVTLRAHLDATAVDLLPDPMYVWRERVAGTSISQQTADIGNIRDRARAAHLVLDMVDARASEQVTSLVHSYFVHVDVWELIQSMLVIGSDDREELERHVASLVDRIPPERTVHVVGLHPWLYRAARAHDWALVRGLTRWWHRQGWDGFKRELPPTAWTTPLRLDAVRRLALGERRTGRRHLPCRLESVSVVDGRARLVLAVRLRSQTARLATASVTVGGEAVACHSSRGGRGLLVEVDLPDAAAGAVLVDVDAGPLRYRGGPEVADTPRTLSTRSGWVQAASVGGTLAIVRPDVVIADAVADGQEWRLRFDGPGVEAVLVERPYPDAPLRFALDADGGVRLSPASVVHDDPADNPVTGQARRPIVADGPQGRRPVYLATADLAAQAGGRRCSLTADEQGRAVVVHAPEES